jgi:rfaE bifunctional protein nucleotidyltransferase chain/domain
MKGISGDNMAKIYTLDELKELVENHKKNGKKITLCHGCFDLVHMGHIRHFKEAKQQGDILVVTVTEDKHVNKGPDRPFFNEKQRVEFLETLSMIDAIAISRFPEATTIINTLKPDVYVKGAEYESKENDVTGKIVEEEDAVKQHGGRIHFTHDIVFSSSTLINAAYSNLNDSQKDFISDLKKTVSFEDIQALVEKLSHLKVAVVGDTILDEYHHVKAVGHSMKSANLSVKQCESEVHTGGACAIAKHLSSFCKQVELITLIGDQDHYEPLLNDGKPSNLNYHLIQKKDSPTVRKTRYIDEFSKQRIFEVAHINETYLDPEQEQAAAEKIESALHDADVVFLCDFGHYFLSDSLYRLIENKSTYLVVNIQTNSLNFGFNTIKKIQKADYLSIDERELQVHFQDKETSIEELVEKLAQEKRTRKTTITLGARGALMRDKEESVVIPSVTSGVFDTVGAGDGHLSVAGLVSSVSDDMRVVGLLGNIAGGLVTKYLGNKQFIDKVQFLKTVNTILK